MKKQVLFAYGTTLKHKMEELMLNKSLVVQEHSYDSGASRDKCDIMAKIFGCKQLQLFHCVGDVYDTNSVIDRNIGTQLTEDGLAWHSSETESSGRDESLADKPTEKWRDIIPSEVVEGPHFFAHELDKLNQISDIEELLQDLDHVSLTSPPSPAELVTVKGFVNSPHCRIHNKEIYYRAQVCRKIKEDEYRVICLDYGLTREITLSQLYLPCQTLVHIIPSTTLFTLRGLRPSPFSLDLLDTALSILQTLAVGNFTISELLVNQWSAVRVLSDLAAVSPDKSICMKSMMVLSHIAHNSRVRTNGMVSDHAITITLQLVARFVRLKWRDVLLSACTALSAMVLDNPAGAEQLEGGLSDLINLFSHYENDTEVAASVLRIVRNYLGSVDLSKESSTIDSLEIVRSRLPNSSSIASTVHSSSSSTLTSDVISPVARASRVTNRQSLREPNARARTGSRHRRLDLRELADQIEVETQDGEPDRKSTSASLDSHRDYYVFGESTSLTSSGSCSVFESDKQMDCNTVQKLIAGFLNAGIEGKLVYGIEGGGMVTGIHLDRDRRDQLRLGLDRVCSDLIPSLTYNVPTLYFIPICLSEGSDDMALRSFIPNRFVVEIVIRSNTGIDQGYILRTDRRIFVRVGTQNIEASTQHFRELITSKLEGLLVGM